MKGLVFSLAGFVALLALAAVTAHSRPAAPVPELVRVHVYFPRGNPGATCARVYARSRTVRAPGVLIGAMRALVKGPTAAERKLGYGGWFSAKTAGTVRSARVARGIAYVDFRNFSRTIPNASSSCGAALLMAQLDRTARQFGTVRMTLYSFDGSSRAFYEWLGYVSPAGRDPR
jgi:hypothetical protein